MTRELRQRSSVGRSFAAYLRVAARTDWSRARLAGYQQDRVRARLDGTARSSPFLQARRPRHYRDLEAWPLISRGDLQGQPVERLLAPGFTSATCAALATTGSTGEPLRIYFSGRDLRRRWLYFVRMFRAYGLRFLCRLVQIENYRASKIYRPGEHASWDRRSFLSVCDSVDRRLDLLAQADPEAIVGFSTDLAEMARRTRERGMTFPSLRVVMGVGDLMTDEWRADIKSGFGVPVRDFYGAVETGLIAYECPAGTGAYHVNVDNVLVEILQDGRPAPMGEVVVTPLAYEAMPLVRYRLGDIATWADGCRCGSGLPAFAAIQGRQDDVLTLSSGRTLTPRRVTCLFCDSGLRRFRLHQHARGDFTLEVDGEAEDVSSAERQLRSVLDAADRLVVRRTALPPSRRKERNILVERS
jgi:phenylacetate-coenzyme A ligase PaaK-like adenylate-forming protein